MAQFNQGEGKESYDSKTGDDSVATPDWMPEGCIPLADADYDVIILGTGLTNMMLSGLLSVAGKRVLIVDKNNYYGGESASLDLQKLFEKFRGVEASENIPKALGRMQEWAVDLIPKFIMADGNLTKILLHTKVTRYLEFKPVDASYVFIADDGGWLSRSHKIEKVPTTPAEALASGLMGMFQKRKFRNFLIFMDKYDEKDPGTFLKNKTLEHFNMREVFTIYDLDAQTQSFIGHAMMLFPDDEYLNMPASVGGSALKLYMSSMQRYHPYTSPYIYPLYGLGGLPEGFSRMCAINGGTFMLNKPVDEILFKEGTSVAWGIKSGNEVARAKQIIGDASYFAKSMTRVVGQVVRSICILNHPIENTNSAESIQIILPASQLGRKNDVYVCMVSHAHNVCAENHYIAIVSTTVETTDPISELQTGIMLLGTIQERFDSVSDIYEPIDDGSGTACFISRSYDAASHFESAAVDVLSMYERLTGEPLDMTMVPDLNAEDDC